MIKLESEDLPEIGEALAVKQRGLPVFRFEGKQAPVAIVNPFANFQEISFLPTAFSLEEPDYLGYLLRADIGVPVYDLLGLPEFTLIDSPLTALPNNCWLDAIAINLYSPISLSTVEPSLTLLLQVPIADPDLNYSVTIPVGTTVTRVESQGLTFQAADDVENPQTGEFVQNGTTLKLYGDAITKLVVGAELLVYGTAEIETAAIGKIATFDLTGSGLTHIDAIDWMGVSFTPCQNLASPKVGEHFWQLPYLHLVFDPAIAPGLTTKTETVRTYQSFIGSVTYDGVV